MAGGCLLRRPLGTEMCAFPKEGDADVRRGPGAAPFGAIRITLIRRQLGIAESGEDRVCSGQRQTGREGRHVSKWSSLHTRAGDARRVSFLGE